MTAGASACRRREQVRSGRRKASAVAARWRLGPAVRRTCEPRSVLLVSRELDRIRVTRRETATPMPLTFIAKTRAQRNDAVRIAFEASRENKHRAYPRADNESSRKARLDHVDLRVCCRPSMSVYPDEHRSDFVIARWKAAKFDHRRLGRAIAFERNPARAVERGRVRDHFHRAVLSVRLDARSDDEVRWRKRECRRHANRKRLLRAGDGRRCEHHGNHQTIELSSHPPSASRDIWRRRQQVTDVVSGVSRLWCPASAVPRVSRRRTG